MRAKRRTSLNGERSPIWNAHISPLCGTSMAFTFLVALLLVSQNSGQVIGRVMPPPWIIPSPFAGSLDETPPVDQSVLDEETIQRLRTSLSAIALQLSKTLAVDRADLHFTDAGSPQGRLVAQRTQTTLRQLVEIQKMQRVLHTLETPTASCSHLLFSALRHEFAAVHLVRIFTKSGLQAGHTLSFTFDHSRLVKAGLSLESANDFRIYYQPCIDESPRQVHRVIEGIGESKATVHFALVDPLPSDTLIDSYVVVFGNPSSDEALCNPQEVFPLYEDFSRDEYFDTNWTMQRGSWIVANGYLEGRVPSWTHNSSGVPIFYNGGRSWRDLEIQFDIATESTVSLPGVYARVREPSDRTTTAFHLQYNPAQNYAVLRVLADGTTLPGNEIAYLPLAWSRSGDWHRVKLVLTQANISQLFNGEQVWGVRPVLPNAAAESGTLGLGCASTESTECLVRFDNILVRYAVPRPPALTLAGGCSQEADIRPLLSERRSVPADSCRQIHTLSSHSGVQTARNGLYWIKTPSGAVRVYCDMKRGGWTLIGKIRGNGSDITRAWLTQNTNTQQLQRPFLRNGQLASIDATLLATRFAREIAVCNGDKNNGRGSKWLEWPLPQGRDPNLFWRRSVGRYAVQAAEMQPVKVTAWDGSSQTCYQNRYGVGPEYGGVPATLSSTHGGAIPGDLCISVGTSPVITTGDPHGFSSPIQAYDSPTDRLDWPNANIGVRQSSLCLWVR